MAVAKFATNNLVKEHDEYIKFMENREKELKKDGKSTGATGVLFYKKRLLENCRTNHNVALYRAINKWHCIMLSYKIWCELVKAYAHFTSLYATDYKQIVDVSSVVLEKFKSMTEYAIAAAHCDINTKGSLHGYSALA